MDTWIYFVSGVFTALAIVSSVFYTCFHKGRKPFNFSKTKTNDSDWTNVNKSTMDKWPINESPKKSFTADSIDTTLSALSSSKIEDPLEYCNHLQREMKKTKHKIAMKQITSKMTKEQLEEERNIQRKQLEDIYNLMQDQKKQFGIESVDDIREQMRLYA